MKAINARTTIKVILFFVLIGILAFKVSQAFPSICKG